MSYQTTGSPIETTENGYPTLEYQQDGTLTLSEKTRLEILVVGGGGGGGTFGGGAGGGGGVVYLDRDFEAGEYSITVGAGGAGASSSGAGSVGSPSIFSFSAGAEIVKAGGGEGGAAGSGGRSGGDSGGGWIDSTATVLPLSGDNDANTSGGGGGAGFPASGNNGGNGKTIAGFKSRYLFGAGGAGQTSDYTSGEAGLDGGGAAEAAGAPNSGGGGGGSWGSTPSAPTDGGSGVVLIRVYATKTSGQSSKVSGVVQIDGAPKARKVRAFGYSETAHTIDETTVSLSKSLGHATSDPETGEYTIDLLEGYGDRIFVVAFDDYGADFSESMAVNVGDRVHPTTPNAYVWECTGAGTLPAEEPAWIVDEDTAQLYGTASMIARPFYRPMVHGPIAPEVTVNVTPWTPDIILKTDFDIWLDPSDLDTLFQDAAGTIPVEVSGDPVAYMVDKSGNGNDAIQTNNSYRMIYRTDGELHWLEGGGGKFLEIQPFISGTEDRTFYMAFSSNKSYNSPVFMWSTTSGSSSGTDWYMTNESDGLYVRVSGNDYWENPVPENELTLVAYRWGLELGTSSGDALVRINGADKARLGGNSSTINTQSTTMRLYGAGSPLTAATGKFYGLVITKDVNVIDSVEKTEGYYAHKLGIASELPSDHPYKSSAPIIEPAPTSDEYFSSVTLLLHMDGTAGTTEFIDWSLSPKTLRAENGAAIAEGGKFGNALSLDGVNDYLVVEDGILFGDGDFTIEAFIFMTADDHTCEIIGSNSGTDYELVFEVPTDRRLRAQIRYGTTTVNVELNSATGVIDLNTWHHVALTADGTDAKLWVDGTEVAGETISGTRGAALSGVQIGQLRGDRFFAGLIDEIRITKGVARYTADFTPPTAPFPNEGPA